MTALQFYATSLRNASTDAERALWQKLRQRQIAGNKFRRQQPLGGYIVDFVSFDSKLIVELDGGQHAINASDDSVRDAWLNSEGYRVLRFWNNEVFTNMNGVLEAIRTACVR